MPPIIAKLIADNIDNLEVWESLRNCFDPKARIYANHGRSEENAVFLDQASAAFDAEEVKWRDNLKVGDDVDAIKLEKVPECRCWARGKITKRTEPAGPNEPVRLSVSFIEDSKDTDRELSVYSRELAPIEQGKSAELDKFREGIKAGDFIDCYDTTKAWYKSTVLSLETQEKKGT